MNAFVQINLDRVTIGRLCRLGYMTADDRDPAILRDAVTAALATALAPSPAALSHDQRV